MAKFNGFVLTELGRELLAKGLNGETITFTKMQIGDGTTTTDARNMTNLVSPKTDLNIINISTNGGQCTLNALLSNTEVTTGYYIRELGIFARGNNNIEILYAYNVSTNPDFLPPFSSNNVVEIEYEDTIIIDQVANVTAVIDPSITYLTKETADKTYTKKTDLATDTKAGIITYNKIKEIIPKSDSLVLNDSNTVASSKAIKDLNDMTVKYTDGYKITDKNFKFVRTDGDFTWISYALKMFNIQGVEVGGFHVNGNYGYMRNINRNNNQWERLLGEIDLANINNRFVVGLRLSSRYTGIVWNQDNGNERAGYVLTGVNNFNKDSVIDNVQMRALQYQLGNGTWVNVPFV